jgi:hypothetical protein
MTTCLFIGMLMPAIRAIYFSTLSAEKWRASIYENVTAVTLDLTTVTLDAACAGRPTNK